MAHNDTPDPPRLLASIAQLEALPDPGVTTPPTDEQPDYQHLPATSGAERGQGICRTCCLPIWNEGGTVNRIHRPEGWSDRIERGGDSLVCFKAVHYRHVPLEGREAAIWDRAYAIGLADVGRSK